MVKTLEIGDRVRYTRTFLQSISAYTGWYPQARGTISRIIGELAFVTWDNPSGVNDPAAVNLFNLERSRTPAPKKTFNL